MDARSCDICGATPATRVEVGVSIDGVVPGSVRTGHAEGIDACKDCRVEAIERLAVHSREQLLEQIPFHVSLAEARERADRATADVQGTTAAAVAGGGLEALPPETRDLHLANVKVLADVQAEQQDILREATVAADRRAHTFRSGLTKKG